jgi:hypothetical protein
MIWTRKQLALLHDGGIWMIPRSGCLIRVLSHSKLEAEVQHPDREPLVLDIMRAQGWKCIPMKERI